MDAFHCCKQLKPDAYAPSECFNKQLAEMRCGAGVATRTTNNLVAEKGDVHNDPVQDDTQLQQPHEGVDDQYLHHRNGEHTTFRPVASIPAHVNQVKAIKGIKTIIR